jgi:hypothetical protein
MIIMWLFELGIKGVLESLKSLFDPMFGLRQTPSLSALGFPFLVHIPRRTANDP